MRQNKNKATKDTSIKRVRQRRKLNKEEKAFLSSLSSTDLYTALESVGWKESDLEEHLSMNVFANAYYDAIGLSHKQVKFLRTFARKMCNIKATCESVSIARKSYYRWIEKNQVFADEVEAIREGLYDDAESILYEKVFIEKDITSLIWFTRTKMKHRGYTERQEVDMSAQLSGGIETFNKTAKYTPEQLQAEIEKYEKKVGIK